MCATGIIAIDASSLAVVRLRCCCNDHLAGAQRCSACQCPISEREKLCSRAGHASLQTSCARWFSRSRPCCLPLQALMLRSAYRLLTGYDTLARSSLAFYGLSVVLPWPAVCLTIDAGRKRRRYGFLAACELASLASRTSPCPGRRPTEPPLLPLSMRSIQFVILRPMNFINRYDRAVAVACGLSNDRCRQ